MSMFYFKKLSENRYEKRRVIMFLYVSILITIGSVFSSNLSFTENVSFRNKIINNYKLQRHYGCQTSLEICSKLCEEVALCASFFYKEDCNICQLHSTSFKGSATRMSEVGWKYYYRPIDCQDAFEAGNTLNGVYEIYRNGSIYDVYCDMNRNGWTVFQRRMDGSTNFYRDWNSYVSGFGNISREYWLGLDKINELTTSAPYLLRIDMEDHASVRKYATYRNFSLLTHTYKLSFDTYSGTAGDGLSYHRLCSFSTKDKDNDNNLHSCAISYGAWWYNSCHRSNLNGFYGSTEQAKGLIWSKWHGYKYSLKSTEMKIRRM